MTKSVNHGGFQKPSGRTLNDAQLFNQQYEADARQSHAQAFSVYGVHRPSIHDRFPGTMQQPSNHPYATDIDPREYVVHDQNSQSSATVGSPNPPRSGHRPASTAPKHSTTSGCWHSQTPQGRAATQSTGEHCQYTVSMLAQAPYTSTGRSAQSNVSRAKTFSSWKSWDMVPINVPSHGLPDDSRASTCNSKRK